MKYIGGIFTPRFSAIYRQLRELRFDSIEYSKFCFYLYVLVDFCKLAINFLSNGPDLKLYNTAAQKLSVETIAIQNCVYGLVNLLLECCKYDLNEVDFRDSMLTIGFTTEQQTVLYKFYQSKKKEISEVLEKLSVNEWHYDNLEWRLEVEISSRSLSNRLDPLIAMDLILKRTHDVDTSNNIEHNYLQMDLANLVHFTQELENCLEESRSRHSRKIQKIFCNKIQ